MTLQTTLAYVYYGGPGGLGATGTPSNADWKATIGVYEGIWRAASAM